VALSLCFLALKAALFTRLAFDLLLTTVPEYCQSLLLAKSPCSTYRHACASLLRALPALVVPQSGFTGSPSMMVGQVLPSLKT
jgi:hypothetical protein